MKKLLSTLSMAFLMQVLIAQKEISVLTDGGDKGTTNTTTTQADCNTPLPNADKKNAITICSKSQLSVANLAKAGTDLNEIALPNSSITETHSAWYTFGIATAGTLEFSLSTQSKNPDDDLDFILFKKDTKGNWTPIRAATNGPEVGGEKVTFCQGATTGLRMGDPDLVTKDGCTTSPESINDGFVAGINALPKEQYLLCINNYFSCAGFLMNWSGTCTFANCPISTKISSNTNNGDNLEVSEAFPNPTDDQINLTIYQPEASKEVSSEIAIHIVDIAGRVSIKQKHNLTKGVQNLNFETLTLPQGIYQIIIDINNERFIRRFVKQ
jgi:Secretion system C-terminal sorting domain